jgi:hypothetical protein
MPSTSEKKSYGYYQLISHINLLTWDIDDLKFLNQYKNIRTSTLLQILQFQETTN